jgi:DNA polymerase V
MVIFCIDLKSFYASVECVLRGLNPYTTNLVVADKERGPGSIVLAVSPKLRTYGVSSRCRIFDLPKDPDIIYAKPRMKKYIEFSSKIYSVYLKYVGKEDIHVYSIDEAFLDLTTYMKYYNKTAVDIAGMIIDDIFRATGITASCGIGDNMFLAKVALDILAKHQPTHVAYLNQDLFKRHIWDIMPLRDIWGIGAGVEKRLNRMGIYTLRDLAHFPLSGLEKAFGILGRELLEHAYGIDHSTIKEVRNYLPRSKSFGHGQILYRDYNYQDLEILLTETVDEIATELVTRRLTCRQIAIGIGYSKKVGGGFSRQMVLPHQTNSRKILMESFLYLYRKHIKDFPIRAVYVRVGKLANEDYVQLDLFSDTEKNRKEHDLYQAIGQIKRRYGNNAIHLALSKSEKSTFIKRNELIGGHNAE